MGAKKAFLGPVKVLGGVKFPWGALLSVSAKQIREIFFKSKKKNKTTAGTGGFMRTHRVFS